jgi:hypothetical protein
LAGALAYFLYVYASMALGAAYNWLFLVYVALLSTSLFAFVGAVAARDLRFTAAPPRLAPAIFMLVCGLVTAFVWLGPLVVAALERRPPDRLDGYTTMVTYALDLAIVAPATWLSAALILRRRSLGYVLAFALTTVLVLLGPVIAVSTYNQVSAGIAFGPGEIAGPVVGFLVLGAAGLCVMASILRVVGDDDGGTPAAGVRTFSG